SDRFLPDKAVDLIDEAGARLRIQRMSTPPEIKEYDARIEEVRKEKEAAIDGQDFEGAASLRDKEQTLQDERNQKEQEWRDEAAHGIAEVDEDLIAEVLSKSTGIPVFRLSETEAERLRNMEDELHRRVIGQDEAVKSLSRAIRRTRAGLKDPHRPTGSFIFAGPTGVGKTELAKTLSEFLFGDEDALITLDMSEFQEKHTVSRLFGAPPGYVGYEEGGQLTEQVRRRPFSVVLFDEVEKAHQDLFNSLLQILEEGRLTDSQGRVVDFKNTVIIMTTNLGTFDIARGVQTGFQSISDTETGYERMKATVQQELRQHFRPEFLNRVDDVIVFPQLSLSEIIEIVDLFIGSLQERLKEQNMSIELDQASKELLAERGYDPSMGARPLRRTVQDMLEDKLSEKLLFGEIPAHTHILVTKKGEGKDAELVFEYVNAPDTIEAAPEREAIEAGSDS
ncbi:MAG: ATP-dependent Clp protease ATP-binding subunit, partial [Yaniella sp.]|nr:ATP-dependent Clp protease ATP-binding subunit [Yaniella sp.]